METPQTLTVKELQEIRGLINFVYSRDSQGKYLELPEKVNAGLSKKLLLVKRVLKPIDQKIDDLRETHLQKGEDGNFKTENNDVVYKTKSSAKVLSEALSEIEKEVIPVNMGAPVSWEEMIATKINGSVLADLVIAGIVSDPKE